MSVATIFLHPGARVWFAWQSLDRDEKGRPPSIRSIEEKHEIAHGTINKLIEARAKVERTNHERLVRIAEALNTTPEWLLRGDGKPPQSRWQVPPWPGPKKKPASGTMRAVKVSK